MYILLDYMLKLLNVVKSRYANKIIEAFKIKEEMSQVEVARTANLSRATAIKWLRAMVDNDLLMVKQSGRQLLYRLNSDNPVLRQLKILSVVAALYPLSKELSGNEVYLYGSVARGEDAARSDVDILIIGKADPRKISRWAAKASKVLGREVKPLIRNPVEYSALARKDRIFYENVEKNIIRLV